MFKSAKRLGFDYANNFCSHTAAVDQRGAQCLAAEICVGSFLIDHTRWMAIVSSLVLGKPMAIGQRKS